MARKELDPTDYRTRRRQAVPTTAVVANDFHFPYHDPLVLILFMSFLRHLRPNVLIINGDAIDMSPISRFMKDPRRLNQLQDDVDMLVSELLRPARQILGDDALIVYNEGNHEQWLKKYLWTRAPELSGLRALDIRELLCLNDLNIQYVTYEDHYEIGNMVVHHGEATNKYSARSNLETWGCSGISGHTHRLWSYAHRSYANDLAWYENGCMCLRTVAKEYKKTAANWQKGFSVLSVFDDRTWVEQVRILEGRPESTTRKGAGSDVWPVLLFRGSIFKIERKIALARLQGVA